ncbi:RNA polymerase II mediator complex subunit [Cadophora gregata]|uniref:RNA polymerase II mediator complex subunit n=1 Tax=Cadophora gregata TaxID=51156 RepID=UPI0026DA8565|nr:RNA polymerase II mediator complex subunit [Cadophora gregata]KAK0105766.1 RNA polymerase II mediator complex subunit [Cadophora gregata]
MVALDFISLLLSKDAPVQASLSLSPHLQQMVGVKTLGADKLAGPRTTEAQKQDNRKVAKGWKARHLNKTVDSILASATRLEKEIEHETKYWEQVLAVSEKGWAICRLPNQKHILGVRFGFSESSPAFKSRSLAALNRTLDGSVSLDQGLAEAQPKSLRVRVEVDGVYTGSSTLPKAVPHDSPVEALILQARNTIFSEELWQELNRETRVLEPVKSKDGTLIYQLSATRTMVLDLVPLEEEPVHITGRDDAIAEGIFLALSILLSFAHRQAYRRRAQIPPPITLDKRTTPPLNILRPFITRVKHQEMTSALRDILRPLHRVLFSLKLESPPTYTQVRTVWPPLNHLSIAERTVLALTERLEVTATLTITPTTTITIKAQTHSHPTIYPQFFLSISPPTSPLHITCPAPPRLDTLSSVQQYIYYATSCTLASLFVPSPHSPLSTPHLEPPASSPHTLRTPIQEWVQSTTPSVLTKPLTASAKTKQLAFTIRSSPAALSRGGARTILRVQWEWARGDLSGVEKVPFPRDGLRSDLWGDGERAGAVFFTEREKMFGVKAVEGGETSGEGGSGGEGKEEESGTSKRKRGLQAEGYYEWIAWVGEDDDDKGFFEVVRSLGSVVESAGTLKEGDKEGEKEKEKEKEK